MKSLIFLKKIQRSGELEGYEECEESSHSSYPFEFFSIFGFGFFRKSFDHLLSVMNLFKQYPNHMKFQKILKYQRSGEMGGYEEYVDSSHSLYSS